MFGLEGSVVHSFQVTLMSGRAEPDCSLDKHLPNSLEIMPYTALAESCFGNDRSVDFLCQHNIITSDS